MNITYPLLIDGGLSNVLEQRGHDLNHKLWTAKLLDHDPEEIVEVHLAYLKAGARCITTASYQASIPGLMAVGYKHEEAEALILKSVKLAEIAVKRFMKSKDKNSKPLIAASIGPYGAYLADGSEYRGNYGITDKTLHTFHFSRFQLLNTSGADILACETIPSLQEAKVLSAILLGAQKKAWVSFSCKNERQLNDGTSVGEAVALFADHPNVFAIGVNCTAPKYVSGLISNIKETVRTKKIMVYPNSGENYDAKTKTWQRTSKDGGLIKFAKEWIEAGANIIGGCCRIGPEQIARMHQLLTPDGRGIQK